MSIHQGTGKGYQCATTHLYINMSDPNNPTIYTIDTHEECYTTFETIIILVGALIFTLLLLWLFDKYCGRNNYNRSSYLPIVATVI